MAYEFARIGLAAGDRLADLWDAIVVSNAKWSVFDAAAGANAKTYRCNDAPNNVDFYVYVNDNQADFSIVELWGDWDEVGHAGVGDSIGGTADKFRIHSVGGVHVCVSDHRVLLGCSWNAMGYYIGQPIRFDTTKNMPFYIGGGDNTSNFYNALGRFHLVGDTPWQTLWDHLGNVGVILGPWGYNSAYKFARTCRGTYVFEDTVVYENTNKICLGYLDGVCHLCTASQGFRNGEIITCEDGDWLILGGTYSTKYWAALRLQ